MDRQEMLEALLNRDLITEERFQELANYDPRQVELIFTDMMETYEEAQEARKAHEARRRLQESAAAARAWNALTDEERKARIGYPVA